MAPFLAASDRVVDYVPVLILMIFAAGFAVLSLVMSWLAGSKGKGNPVKDAAYECGMPPITDAHQRFSVKFYLVAILFVLFDIEVIFIYLWALVFRSFPDPVTAFASMLVFVAILLFGLAYAWRKGVLTWK